MSAVEPTPTLDIHDEDVFLGEEIIFLAGLQCSARVDARELYGRTCHLAVTAPDGRTTALVREPSSYDGPSRIARLRRREHLPDLAGPLVPGTYEIRYACEGREARRQIRVHERAEPGPRVDIVFPDRAGVAPGGRFLVRVEVANVSSGPRSFVAPDSCYAASVVGFVNANDPPSWSALNRDGEPEAARGAAYFTPIDAGTRGALVMVNLPPAGRRAYEVSFREVLRESLDDAWRPRERFAVTVGLVVHEFDPGAQRPLRWLRRATAEYLVTGALQSAGEARCEAWEWVRVSPSRG